MAKIYGNVRIIDDEDIEQGFLAARPIFVDKDKKPIMSADAWINKCIEEFLINTAEQGMRKLHNEAFTFNRNIIDKERKVI